MSRSRSQKPYCKSLTFGLIQHIDSFNGCVLRKNCTDASEFVFGGYFATLDSEPVRGTFSPADVNTRSTYRELKAAFYVLKSYGEKLRHQNVKLFVDNMGAYRILMVGSPSLIAENRCSHI